MWRRYGAGGGGKVGADVGDGMVAGHRDGGKRLATSRGHKGLASGPRSKQMEHVSAGLTGQRAAALSRPGASDIQRQRLRASGEMNREKRW